MERIDPDCVVSFHPLLNHISVRAVRSRTRRIPVVTVITDLVDIHVAWICAGVDAVVVPSPGALDQCRRAGIPASRCHDFGLAVDRRFTELPSDPAGIAEIRRRLGLRTDAFVVLVCGGADGSGGLVKHARAIAASSADVDLVVICGRNDRARAALTGLRARSGRAVRVLGYVDNMAEWMRASDVVVSKAGPGTIAEALCCGLPLLLVWYLPGQERGNVEWVVDIGAGRYVPRDEQLVDAVAELAAPGSEALARMRAAVRAAARPDATRRIAGLDRFDCRSRRVSVDAPTVDAPAEPAGTAAPRCAIVRLRVHCFRNYPEATVRFGPGLNVIHGQNAQGKTNLLEAIATLALTRSPRTTSSGDLLLWTEDAALAEADVTRPPADVTLSVRFQRDASTGRVSRVTAVDGKPRPARGVLGVCPVVLFWPEDLALVRGGPDGRRRFLDVILAQTDQQAIAHMSRYRRLLEQRNALLHQLRLGGGARDSLNSFTGELAHHGAWLEVARSRLTDALAPLAALSLHDLSGQRERISLRYAPAHAASIPDTVEAAEQVLLETLRERASEEVARGITLAGPHRDDLAFDLDGRPARGTASQGQQRSIVLACKLAEVRYLQDASGVAPVILLDDVLSELDPQRRGSLLALLAEGRHQVLVTATEPLTEVADFADVLHFTVRSGVVTRDERA